MAQAHALGAAHRLERLDGLRAIAALVVVAYHARLLFVPDAFVGASPVLAWVHAWGWAFVDLFFVLSGYLFAHVYAAPGRLSGGRGLADFAVARFARLYPLHLVLLLVTAFLFAGKPGSDAAAFLAHLVMGQAFVRPFADTFNGPSWSLTIECLCYLVFALSAAAGQRTLLLVTAACVVGGASVLALTGPPGGPWATDLVPRGLLGFFVGQAVWQGRDWLTRIPSVGLVTFIAAGLWLADGPWSPLVPLDLLAWPAVLLLALRRPLLQTPAMVWLGERSYAIYLVHMPLIELVAKRFGPVEAGLGNALWAHAGLAVAVLLLADAALRRIERPSRAALRRAWGMRYPGAAAAPA